MESRGSRASGCIGRAWQRGLPALLVLAGCASGPDVRVDYDRAVDFATYRTFAFESPLGTDRSGYEGAVSRALKSSARRELEARGLRFDEDAPMLRVNFNGRLSQKLRVSAALAPAPAYYGYRTGYYSAWPAYGAPQYDTYTEGTLNVDVIDVARRQLVWESVVVGMVTAESLANVEPAIDVAVKAAFSKFPVAASTR
jgi:hypothetical protein